MSKWFFAATCALEPTYIAHDADARYTIMVPWPELKTLYGERRHALYEAKERRNVIAWRIVQALNQSENRPTFSDLLQLCQDNDCVLLAAQDDTRMNGPYLETGKVW